MAPNQEKSSLKRARGSKPDQELDTKKPRRSQRISSHNDAASKPQPDKTLKKSQLPSPLTHKETTIDTSIDSAKSPTHVKDGTVTPPEGRPSQIYRHTSVSSPRTAPAGLASPPQDTQPFSQALAPPGLSSQVQDEEGEGVWGYLIPLDHNFGDTLVLRDRSACALPEKKTTHKQGPTHDEDPKHLKKEEETYEEKKIRGTPSGGYLIGRHPECDRVIDKPTISNRHCLIFREIKGGDAIAVLEDLSGNGTFVNESFVGRNKRRELREGDEVAVLDKARFIFRYPSTHNANSFQQQYAIMQQLGKGHFATVYLAVEKSCGNKYAVKKFDKRGPSDAKSKALDGLQQEIGVLMGVSHPHVLCLRDTFDESDGIYLVLELAPEGELFNHIVERGNLSEENSRHVFIQLFKGLKYLHERNIVHRDIKPENILLLDKNLTVKLADFGLAKIIGEDSFTTTLCGTPSYVAPEILENSNHRRYTKAVDIWSLGVVLYICLCGFPPFSEELNTPQHPYALIDQIRHARFDYPSPYWDSVSDLALDLIDKMLTVEVDMRISVEEVLEHPWTTQAKMSPYDSADSLTGALGSLDFSKRKPLRERTLLSNWNSVRVADVYPPNHTGDGPVKVFEKNKSDAPVQTTVGPAKHEDLGQFAKLGAGADETLFGEDPDSRYAGESQGAAGV